MKKKKAEKKQLFIDDWIDREDDFVHRGGLRSGWDEGYDTTADYVLKGFLKPVTPEGEVREIHNLCTNRCNILSDGKRVLFTMNPSEKTAKTDGKKVTVGTSVLDEPGKTFSQKADIMIGLTTHEMAHVLYSTFTHLKKVKSPLHKAILNVIEDERIEHLICDEYPGYASGIANLKKYFFEEKYLIDEALSSGSFSSEVEKRSAELFDILFKMVRYPKNLSEELVNKHKASFEEMKALMSPYPMTAAKVLEVSEKIYNIICKDMLETGEKEMESGEFKPEDSKPDESAPDKSGKHEAIDEPDPTVDEFGNPIELDDEAKLNKVVRDAEKMIGDMMKSFESDNDPDKEVEVSPAIKDIDFREEFIYDVSNKATFKNGKSNQVNYEIYKSEVAADSAKLARCLYTYVFDESSTMRGMRSGNLDEYKIIDALQGSKTVHYQRTEKQVKSVNIVLLIDESGSMMTRTRFIDAAKSAILIEQAFKKFPVGKLFIYGFTGDYKDSNGSIHHNYIIRYREPGLNIPFGLGDVRPRANNRDGECIRAVANRVREITNEPMLFFIISDGQPSANGYGGFADTRAAVVEVTKKKFFPIQIGIGSAISPKDQKQMFDDFIHYKDSKQMVDDLRKLIVRKARKVFAL